MIQAIKKMCPNCVRTSNFMFQKGVIERLFVGYSKHPSCICCALCLVFQTVAEKFSDDLVEKFTLQLVSEFVRNK